MESDTQELNPRLNELVAVGASVSAGCHPCLNHHLNAGAQAGLESSQLLAAVTNAEAVASEATVLLADHAREKLGATSATLTLLEETLAAFGAALAANDAAAIDLQMRSAHGFGASRSQLQQAIETAKTVQEHAGRIHVRTAERLLDEIAPASAVADQESPQDPSCGCGGDDASEPAAQAHEPAAQCSDPQGDASGGASFKPSMAECFASAENGEDSGPAAVIAHCKQIFAGPFSEPGDLATTEEPPAAPGAKSCSGKKEV